VLGHRGKGWQAVAHGGRKKADEALAVALAAGQTLRTAAQSVRIGERTAARRWADPLFRRRVSELQHEMIGRCLGRMADGMVEAADMLRTLLAAKSETVRLGAARALLELGVRVRDAVELDRRVQQLEDLAAAQAEGDGHGQDTNTPPT
jgi:HEAT repeat protein